MRSVMNKYFAIASLIAFVAWSGFMYYEGYSKESAVCKYETDKHDLAQTRVTVAAQKAVLKAVAQQQTITQGIDHEYQTKRNDIDSQYASAPSVLQSSEAVTARHNLPTAGNATSRPPAAAQRPLHTKVFKLNAQECDENTEQLYGLQQWIRGQQSIKQAH